MLKAVTQKSIFNGLLKRVESTEYGLSDSLFIPFYIKHINETRFAFDKRSHILDHTYFPTKKWKAIKCTKTNEFLYGLNNPTVLLFENDTLNNFEKFISYSDIFVIRE